MQPLESVELALSFAMPDPTTSGRSLAAWLGAHADALGPVDEAVTLRLGDFRDLRAAVLEALDAVSRGRAVPGAAVERLNESSALVPFAPRLDPSKPGGPLVEEPPARGRAVDVLAAVARSAIRLLGSDQAGRLRRCPSCSRFFLASRPGRVWCTPACGNRARVARHHARRRGTS